MKVTPGVGNDATLEERVRAELVMLRKQRHGLTVESLAQAHTICALLGAGDPYVAHSRLVHEILESDLGISIQAVAASIGLSSDEDSHLRRLDDFGATAHLDQRQVRRYSDKGIGALARLISTNWPTETVPQLTVMVSNGHNGWELIFVTARLNAVRMSGVRVEALTGAAQTPVRLAWQAHSAGLWDHAFSDALVIADETAETSVSVVWRGELWPKWNVEWSGTVRGAASEAVGNKLMLRLRNGK